MKLYFYVAKINQLPAPLRPNIDPLIRIYYIAHITTHETKTTYKLQCVLLLPFHLNASRHTENTPGESVSAS